MIRPKYRRKVSSGRLRRQIGTILRDRCRPRGVELVQGHAMPDHVYLCISAGRLLIEDARRVNEPVL
ncbi:MAG: transposase [Planctomycetaceae bacterium]|nr:transposase [Planctomycetaceae bacterium]